MILTKKVTFNLTANSRLNAFFPNLEDGNAGVNQRFYVEEHL